MTRNQPPDAPERIKQLRARWGLSQQGLAELLGVSEHSVIRWERGQTRPTALAWQQLVRVEAHAREAPVRAEKPDTGGVRRPATNLPGLLTSFIGREREVLAVRQRLATARLLTLSGAGGCGKTRLALAVASGIHAGYPDGVWLVELASLADARLVPRAVADVLGVREEPGRPLVQRLVANLQPRELLLVLDNCEHLLESCSGLVETLLRNCPEVRVLATSREPLNVAVETVWQVPPLGLPAPGGPPTVDARTACEAVRLFVERARGRSRGFALSTSNAAAIEQVCQRLDGLPLAIELAAARVLLLSAEQIAARLGDRFRLLTGSSRNQPGRHHTLRAAIDWSYDLLTRPEQMVFSRLGVFAGAFELEAAEAVGGGEGVPQEELLDLLGRLVTQSLVVAEEYGDTARYRLLDTLRAYARERLAEDQRDTDGARARQAAYYLALAERAEPELKGARQTVWLERLEAEHDNLRQVLEWSLERQERGETGLRLSAAVARFWLNRGHITEGRRWLAELLARPVPSAAVRAKALGAGGTLAHFQGDHFRARALQEESLALWRVLGDKRGIAAALNNLGDVARHQCDYALATAWYKESVALAQEAGDRWRVASSLHHLGDVARHQADYSLARERYESSLALWRELGDEQGITAALTGVGEVAHQQGDQLMARALHEKALALARQLGNTWAIAWVLNNLGDLARAQGEYLQAQSLLAESLALRRELGDRQGLAHGLCSSAMLAAACQQPRRAARLLGAATALAEELGAPLALLSRDRYDAAALQIRGALGERAYAASVAAGRAMTLDRAVRYVIEPDSEQAAGPPQASGHLTGREREVLELLAVGASNKEIAQTLQVSPRTVERHVANLYTKIRARGRADAIAYALRRDLSATETLVSA